MFVSILASKRPSVCKIRRLMSSCHISEALVCTSKNPTLADESVSLDISGLKARQKVTLHASVRLPNSSILESFSHYTANDDGCVFLNQHESLGGSFTGVEPMGPFSYMVPSPINKRKYERFLIKDPTIPFDVSFRVYDSFIESLEKLHEAHINETVPNLTLTRSYMAPGVREFPVWDGRIRGTLYMPPGEGPFPGVISMSGGYPGAMKHKAALLASHGFAAIALKYFGEDDLPQDMLIEDLGYIEEAAHFIQSHPLVDANNGLGIVANCNGATLGLGLASVSPPGLISCVVAVNGWCFPIGQITYKDRSWGSKVVRTSSMRPGGIREWRFSADVDEDTMLRSTGDYFFPFHERHETAFMFISGGNDGYFPSDVAASITKNLLKSSRHPDYEYLYYPKAGHLIEHSFYPMADIAWTFNEPHFCGGEQPEHAKAQEDSWPRLLEFVRRNLTQP